MNVRAFIYDYLFINTKHAQLGSHQQRYEYIPTASYSYKHSVLCFDLVVEYMCTNICFDTYTMLPSSFNIYILRTYADTFLCVFDGVRTLTLDRQPSSYLYIQEYCVLNLNCLDLFLNSTPLNVACSGLSIQLQHVQYDRCLPVIRYNEGLFVSLFMFSLTQAVYMCISSDHQLVDNYNHQILRQQHAQPFTIFVQLPSLMKLKVVCSTS